MLAGAHDRFFTLAAMSARYALYYAPAAGSAWASFGAQWFAREEAWLREPRRYGFHATLKAPFRLRPDSRLEDLIAELDAFTRSDRAFAIPAMRVSRLDGFYALTPAAPEPRLDRLAAQCVKRFDRFRAPLSAQELDRRRRVPLTRQEEALLARWGYPFVLGEFRFHLSLTGVLAEAEDFEVPGLPEAPLAIDAVSLFEEPAPGAQFRELHRSPLCRRGRLVYVVGASGSGKDSMIDWARHRSPADVAFAQRTISRPVQPGGEQHRAVDDAGFDELLARGAFALHWRANGHRYGVGGEIDDWLALGRTVVVNGSREHLVQARAAYPQLEVVHVTASARVRRERLKSRRRESSGQIEARLRRAPPVDAAALHIENDASLAAAGNRLLRFLAGA
jgi:ribose 1,5-bisphosphokinase